MRRSWLVTRGASWYKSNNPNVGEEEKRVALSGQKWNGCFLDTKEELLWSFNAFVGLDRKGRIGLTRLVRVVTRVGGRRGPPDFGEHAVCTGEGHQWWDKDPACRWTGSVCCRRP